MHKLVVNKRFSEYDVYIGRPSAWGNPFPLTDGASRQFVVTKYVSWLESQPELIELAKEELPGKVLACFCSPLLCHGDILAGVANEGLTPTEAYNAALS